MPSDLPEAPEADFYEIDLTTPPTAEIDAVLTGKRMRAYGHKVNQLNLYNESADDELNELDARHQAERAAVVARQEIERRPLVESVGQLGRILEMTGRAAHEADPGCLVVQVTGGKIVGTGRGVDWEYPDDEARLLAFATKHLPEAVDHPPRPEPKVNKGKLKKLLAERAVKTVYKAQAPVNDDGSITLEDGTVVPGVRVVPKVIRFSPEPSL